MHAFILAAVLALTPQSAGQPTRDIVMDVCLPYVTAGVAAPPALQAASLSDLIDEGPDRNLQTPNQHYLVRLSTSGSSAEGDLSRVCYVQARVGGFEQARNAVRGPLEAAGFTASPDEPEDWPVWIKGGVQISVHQNPGRATIVRVSYSDLDAEEFQTP